MPLVYILGSGSVLLTVEPNLEEHSSIALTDFNEAAESADIIAYLVSHREFKNLTVNGQVLDFCGVLQNQ
ncbi:hypothetical protein C9988_02655 [Pseudidiomarina aestuarii]|nr:hypothetical protein C9988_02655 [Pseudidiomarina aestuarii]